MKKKHNRRSLIALITMLAICSFSLSGCATLGGAAAVLVPTMTGYVSSSSVTSADQSAKAVKDVVNYFLKEADTAGYGMFSGADTAIEATIENGTLTVYAFDASAFIQNEKITYGSTQQTIAGQDSKESATSGEKLLAIELADTLQECENGSMWAYCKDGKCLYAMWSTDFTDRFSLHSDVPTVDDCKSGSFAWNGSDGVVASGYIIGTNPKLMNAD